MASYAEQKKDVARPTFYMEAVKNNAKSEAEGRPIFDEKEFIKIDIPGDKNMNWIGEVEESHRNRWPDQYAAFKRGEARAASGTPLEHWPNPELTKARVAEIKAQNILSVEELAGIGDNQLGKLGFHGRELREAARAYIAQAKDSAGASAMAARVAQLEEMVKRLSGNVPPEPEQKTKSIEDCTDAELKEFIKRETGEGVRGNPNRETLVARARAIAEPEAA
jgi:hypothetical protein